LPSRLRLGARYLGYFAVLGLFGVPKTPPDISSNLQKKLPENKYLRLSIHR
jgi:hypothetical protein